MYSAFNRPKTEAAETGNPYEPEYNIEFDKNGKKNLVKVGETNTYSLIQESYEATKIENIMRRATEGDPNALNLTNGMYMDITDMPTSLAEMQNFVIKAQNEFDKLPIEIRKKFNMNVSEYIAEFGKDSFIEKIGLIKPEPAAEPEEVAKPKEVAINE